MPSCLNISTYNLEPRSRRLDNMSSLFPLLTLLFTLFIIHFFNRQYRGSGNRFQSENGIHVTPPTAFRFLDLPVELRSLIYSQVLFTKEPLRWIGPKYHPEYRSGSLLAGVVKVKDRLEATATRKGLRANTATAILLTCKTVYLETINLFYQNNVFAVPATDFKSQPILRREPLPRLVRRLRMQYRGVYDPFRVLPMDYTNRVDVIIGLCLQDVMDRCPNLTSLTIDGIPDPGEVNTAWIVEETGWYDT